MLILVVPVIATAFALVSLWPSARGHWSGPVLALPAVVVGALASYVLLTDDTWYPAARPFAIVPLVAGIASMCLWYFRRAHQDAVVKR